MSNVDLRHGDCLDVLKTLDADSIDSIVTDPPYGLSFMGKGWDYQVPSVDIWAECLRVLKPGGHLLAFAGTRTQHRMAVNIEDAGFEIRDMIAWVYGCLDDQTQYASPDGPRPYHRAKAGDPVLCYDAETKEYSYQPIQDVYVYDYADTAYRLVGDHGVQVVSRNHRCLVERGGVEVFITAEEAAREQQARVPVLEDLSALQQALSHLHEGASHTEQVLRQELLGRADGVGQFRLQADRAAQADQGAVCGVRRRDAQARFMAEANRAAHLQPAMQRDTAGARVEAARQQGALTMEAGIRASSGGADDRPQQPVVEGWAHLSQSQGRLCQSADPLCPLPGRATDDGAEGRLRDGASAAGGAGDWQAADQGRSSTSCQPRCDGQPVRKPDAVRHQRPAQGVRAWSGHQTALVRIEPFHHTGKVWCLKVPTGCFVAVRDGMAFPTGNSGFPKSMDVSKAIDKHGGSSVAWFGPWFRKWRAERGITQKQVAALFPSKTGGLTGCVANWELGFNLPTPEQFNLIRDTFGLPFESINAAEREVVGKSAHRSGIANRTKGHRTVGGTIAQHVDITAPATPEAQQWAGWGTALKPALEPITVARKPFKGTVAANVLEHGTGALNIDGCRVAGEPWKAHSATGLGSVKFFTQGETPVIEKQPHEAGRWPANLIHDGSEEVTELFPYTTSGKPSGIRGASKHNVAYADVAVGSELTGFGDSGSAARFFYTAKASKDDRDKGNTHPTVKPTDLMAYLCRLVTPPGGIVLDPFMGSGTTGKAALSEGFQFVGIERDPDYYAICESRFNGAQIGLALAL